MKLILNILLVFPFLGFGQSSAFISGNDTLCDNANKDAEVKIYFSGATPPVTFVYAINGVSQPSITTTINPYVIYTQQAGNYTLTYFSDANNSGSISGSARVTVLESPAAIIGGSDTLSVNFTAAQLIDMSLGNIVNWIWDFGDNSLQNFTENPYHTYPQWPPTVYQVTLIVLDNMGCSDTAFSTITVGQPTTSIQEHAINKEHLKVTDLLGRETKGTKNEVLFYIYDDGTVEKRIIIE